MGANFTEVASTRAAQAVTLMSERFDGQTDIHPEATAHTTKCDVTDIVSIVKVLQQRDVLGIHKSTKVFKS